MDIKEVKEFFEKLPNRILFKCLTDDFVKKYDTAYEVLVKALDKQEEKELKCLTQLQNSNKFIGLCPNCDHSMFKYIDYCEMCGQKIKN